MGRSSRKLRRKMSVNSTFQVTKAVGLKSLPLEINRVKKHALRAIVQPVLVILTISRTLTIWTWTTWMNGRCQEHQHITSFNPMVLWLGSHLKTPVKK